jgi:hypothetical protein
VSNDWVDNLRAHARAQIAAPVTPEQLNEIEDDIKNWQAGRPMRAYHGHLLGVSIPRMIRDIRALWAENAELRAERLELVHRIHDLEEDTPEFRDAIRQALQSPVVRTLGDGNE